MFWLSKFEKRLIAEQQVANAMLEFAAKAIPEIAKVRIAEAQCDSELIQLRKENEALTQLVKAYRAKRESDGLNGRKWAASEHWKAEELIKKLDFES